MKEGGKHNHSVGKAKGFEQTVISNYGNFVNMETEKTDLKYPRSVWKYPRPHPPIHPTQKPVELLEELVRTYTNEGETVLDMFMGIGSTGIASIKANRRFIGIELKKEYFDIAELLIKNIGLFEKSPNKNTLKKLCYEKA